MYANNLDDAFSAFALGTTDEWIKSDRYMMYPEYRDEEYTYIEGRTIGDITAQISVQGEAYSQYISFMIDRYYDGIDLIGMSIWIHYELKDGSGSEDSPVNVMYNDSTIRFGWVIPDKATQQSGDIKIGVWVNGTAPNTKAYILKTEEKIYTIHPGLIPGSGITQPDQTWFENFVEQMDSKVSTAQGHANDAQSSKTAAAGSAKTAAESAAASAQALEDNKAYVESQKETFVGYNKRETDLKYANALIGTASGMGRVTVGDAWEAPIPDLDISGRSEQFSTTGTQLLVYPYYNTTKTQNGITFTALDDGRVSIKGTVTGNNATYILQQNLILPPGTYTKNNPGTIKYMISRYLNGAFDRVEVSQNDGTFDTDGWDYDVYEYKPLLQTVTVGDTFDNLIVSPMLNAGATAKPWEPYTGGKPSPSPDYPQPIISTGTVSTGAQLLDTEKIQYPASVPTIISDNGRTIKVSGGVDTGRAMYDIGLEKVIGRTLYVSGTIASKSVSDAKTVIVLCVQKADDSWEYKYIRDIGIKGLIYAQIPNDAKQVRLDFNINDSNAPLTTVNTAVFKDVIISVDAPNPWEPYTGGKPSPSPDYPQPLDVTVTGDNLFDASKVPSKTVGGATVTNNGDGSFTISGNGALTAMFKTSYKLTREEVRKIFKPGLYTLSALNKTYPVPGFAVRSSVDNTTVMVDFGLFSVQEKTAEITQDMIDNEDLYFELYFYGSSGKAIVPGTVTPMLNASDTALPWQPYQSCTASITLTEPLRGIGDHKDMITMTKRIDRCVELVFDGSENWVAISTYEGFYYAGILPFSAMRRAGLCNQFPVDTKGDAIESVRIGNGNSVLFCVYSRFYDDAAADKGLSAWKAHLAVHPLKVVTYLDTSVETDLDATTVAALNALTTYTGTTHVTVTAGGPEPDVGMGYAQDTNVVIAELKKLIEGMQNAKS